MKKLGIIGCGWLGRRMAQILQPAFEIHTTVTNPAKILDLKTAGFHPEVVDFDAGAVAGWSKTDQLDAIIITVPLFSRSVSEEVLTGRRDNLVHFVAGFKRQMVMMSSTGVYKDKTGEVREAALSPDAVGGERELCSAFPQINILRLGGLMGDDRQLKHYKVSDLDAPVNHVHFKDVAGVVECLLKAGSKGKVYNVVAPMHPTKAAVVGIRNDSETGPPASSDARIVSAQKLISELNYTFQHPDPAKFD